MAEQSRFLLKIDVNPAVKDAVDADIRFVRADGGVGRDERDIVPLPEQRGGECIVVDAGAAVHARGACGDVGDFHSIGRLGLLRSGRLSCADNAGLI